MNVEYPDVQVAAVHSVNPGPLQSVHVSTVGSEAKSLQQNPASMNVEYPVAHVAAVQSLISTPVHEVHTETDASEAKVLHGVQLPDENDPIA